MRELMNRIWKKEEGFSLIELIIVIAILAIIAAIAVPNLLENVANANESRDESNAKLIADAVLTAIAQNPTTEGTGFEDVAFGVEPVAGDITDGDLADAVTIMDAAEATMGTAPELVSSFYTNGTTNQTFDVTLTSAGVVTIENDDDVELYPTPAAP